MWCDGNSSCWEHFSADLSVVGEQRSHSVAAQKDSGNVLIKYLHIMRILATKEGFDELISV